MVRCCGAGLSNSPNANIVRRIRSTMASTVALLTWPSVTAVANVFPK
jgi:hypothetical protein